jgi:hypothetical protein
MLLSEDYNGGCRRCPSGFIAEDTSRAFWPFFSEGSGAFVASREIIDTVGAPLLEFARTREARPRAHRSP